MNPIRKIKKKTWAILALVLAIPPKPNRPAIIATIKKITDQVNILPPLISFNQLRQCFALCSENSLFYWPLTYFSDWFRNCVEMYKFKMFCDLY